ncbi:MAG: WD40/YVTN/BNR-like repeat-containing protein, partial [Rhodothermia bacterium]
MTVLTPRGLRRPLLIFAVLVSGALAAQPLDMDLFKGMKARAIGPAGMSGRVTSIDVVESDKDVIYVGTASGGLWRSVNGGTTFSPIFDDQNAASIGAVAVNQSNPDLIWVGTGEGNPRNSQTGGTGMYRSIDGGYTWQYLGLEESRSIHRIVLHPDEPDVAWIGVQGPAWGETEQRGVFRTTDGGATWEKVLFVNERTGIADLVLDPSNPNKLIAAMWEFRRWPWFFKSGGEGSGIYVTYDGGSSWEKRTSNDGLPKGELGRIGLAIAPSSPDIVYAIVESEQNAVYRSEDGGRKWAKRSDDKDPRSRPFYYADIFVDSQNENRLYHIFSDISRSEDGGKTFEKIVKYTGDDMHPDNHAWWIDPDNPDFMINGNDGGLNITHDRGRTWRFIENLPLAQFYHIRVDDELPYNVYGGMQDNGSWKGPAYVWRFGGIRNAYWQELNFGDGFDVIPDPEDHRYGYAMSQGGHLNRYDADTGERR